MMSRALILAVLGLATALAMPASGAEAERQLRGLLAEFLDGASRNDAEVHDRFWAEDLVYTSSSGERFGKAEIMQGLADTPEDPGPLPRYRGEDVEVRTVGEVTVVTFTLVAAMPDGSTAKFYNTGVFRQAGSTWRAFAWQATRIPEPDRTP